MASCMGFLCFLASILLLCFLFQTFPIANGDQALINSVCSKTGKYNGYCLSCFARSQQADLKGLSKGSVDCASVTSFDTRQAASALVKKATGKFQQDLNQCVRLLDDTLPEYAAATKDLDGGNKSGATNQVNLAKSNVLKCTNLLGINVLPSDDVPADLVSDFGTLAAANELALRVISQV